MKFKRANSLLLCALILITTVFSEPLSLMRVQAAEMEELMAPMTITPTVVPEDASDNDDALVDEDIDEIEAEIETEIETEQATDNLGIEEALDSEEVDKANDDSESDGIIINRGMGRDLVFGGDVSEDVSEEIDLEEPIISDDDLTRAVGDVAINSKNFPDAHFRAYVIKEFDNKPKNGILSRAEITAATYINMFDWRLVKSLKGIEYFTELVGLSCAYNNIKSVDLSKNTKLETLWISNNSLEFLDLSKNTKLKSLNCGYNRLKSLDVSKQTQLTFLECKGNNLSSLNVSKNARLTHLDCADNSISNLDLRTNTRLDYVDCSNNRLTGLDITKNAVMVFLDCSNNQLTTLNTSGNKKLAALMCSNNRITSLDFSSNLNLIQILCGKNALSVLEIPNKLNLEYLEFNSQMGMMTYLSYIKESKDQAIEADWQAVTGASGYDLYRCDKTFSNWEIVAKGITRTTFKDPKVRLSETYNYMVYAYQNTATGKRYFATSVSDARKLSAPSVPQKLKTSVVSATSIKINWDKVNKANGYVVYVSNKKNGTYKAVGNITGTSYNHKDLKPGTTYYYKVRAYVRVGSETVYSGYSAVTSRKQIIPKVTGVKVANSSANSLKVSWSKVADATGYEIYQATSKNGKYKKIATVKKNSTVSYTVKKLSHKKTYYFKIRAYKTISKVTTKGSYSTVVGKKVILAKPTLTAKTRNKTSINLSWKKIGGAKEYEIYRATSKKGKYQKIATTKSLKYTSNKLKRNRTYYYKIKAVQKIGSKTYRSSFSAMKSAKTKK